MEKCGKENSNITNVDIQEALVDNENIVPSENVL